MWNSLLFLLCVAVCWCKLFVVMFLSFTLFRIFRFSSMFVLFCVQCAVVCVCVCSSILVFAFYPSLTRIIMHWLADRYKLKTLHLPRSSRKNKKINFFFIYSVLSLRIHSHFDYMRFLLFSFVCSHTICCWCCFFSGWSDTQFIHIIIIFRLVFLLYFSCFMRIFSPYLSFFLFFFVYLHSVTVILSSFLCELVHTQLLELRFCIFDFRMEKVQFYVRCISFAYFVVVSLMSVIRIVYFYHKMHVILLKKTVQFSCCLHFYSEKRVFTKHLFSLFYELCILRRMK